MTPILQRPLAAVRSKTALLRRLLSDKSGLGGVEFAIVAPLLIVAYLGSFEISVGFTVSRKVSQASSTIADLLSQKSEVSKADLDGMKFVASSVMAPFALSTYTLKMTGIEVTAENTGKVIWSRDATGGTPYKAGLVVTIPASKTMIGTFLARSEMVVPHNILLFTSTDAGSALQKINISKTYYYRQRVGGNSKCTDCGT